MSLKSNYEYIRDWVNSKFLRKSVIDQYYTKNEVDRNIKKITLDGNDYLSKDEYLDEEDIISSALIDLDSRINQSSELINNALGEDEEKTIALALQDLDSRINSSASVNSPSFTGTPTAPTATSGNNSTQIATTAFVANAISEGVPILGVSLNGVSGSLTNHVANVSLTKTSTGAGNIVTDVSIEGNVITVNKSNLPFKANSGTTRPTLTSGDVGYTFLDLSLGTSGKPIWWNGSNWIDSTGATV